MGKKHLIGSRRECLVPAPTLDEMREARRQNRQSQPALTKHTPIVHQRSNGKNAAPVKKKSHAGALSQHKKCPVHTGHFFMLNGP